MLVVDDEDDIRELLDMTLSRMGLDADCAATVGEARRLLSENAYQLCLTDMRLPDGDGLELVRFIGEHCRDLPVAVITAHGSMENAVSALKAGAFDYVPKPVSLDQLRALVKSVLKLPHPEAARSESAGQALLGESPAIRQARGMIEKVARSQAPVYISGESGSGKELAARLIHEQGARREQAFVPVNCGAIPETLVESEFFGYKKGAFTGAEADRGGFFQAASGGTLFLDEVADLPLPMQVKLLRAIQEKRVRKVGATGEDPVDVRIISATHQNLKDLATLASSTAVCVGVLRGALGFFLRIENLAGVVAPVGTVVDVDAVFVGRVLLEVRVQPNVAEPRAASNAILLALVHAKQRVGVWLLELLEGRAAEELEPVRGVLVGRGIVDEVVDVSHGQFFPGIWNPLRISAPRNSPGRCAHKLSCQMRFRSPRVISF